MRHAYPLGMLGLVVILLVKYKMTMPLKIEKVRDPHLCIATGDISCLK